MPVPDPAAVTIKVPFAVRKRGGRKLVLAPDGAPVPHLAPQVDNTLVKAHRPGLSVAEDVRDDEGDRHGREDQPVLCQPGAEVEAVPPATVEAILNGRRAHRFDPRRNDGATPRRMVETSAPVPRYDNSN